MRWIATGRIYTEMVNDQATRDCPYKQFVNITMSANGVPFLAINRRNVIDSIAIRSASPSPFPAASIRDSYMMRNIRGKRSIIKEHQGIASLVSCDGLLKQCRRLYYTITGLRDIAHDYD